MIKNLNQQYNDAINKVFDIMEKKDALNDIKGYHRTNKFKHRIDLNMQLMNAQATAIFIDAQRNIRDRLIYEALPFYNRHNS